MPFFSNLVILLFSADVWLVNLSLVDFHVPFLILAPGEVLFSLGLFNWLVTVLVVFAIRNCLVVDDIVSHCPFQPLYFTC